MAANRIWSNARSTLSTLRTKADCSGRFTSWTHPVRPIRWSSDAPRRFRSVFSAENVVRLVKIGRFKSDASGDDNRRRVGYTVWTNDHRYLHHRFCIQQVSNRWIHKSATSNCTRKSTNQMQNQKRPNFSSLEPTCRKLDMVHQSVEVLPRFSPMVREMAFNWWMHCLHSLFYPIFKLFRPELFTINPRRPAWADGKKIGPQVDLSWSRKCAQRIPQSARCTATCRRKNVNRIESCVTSSSTIRHKSMKCPLMSPTWFNLKKKKI